MNMIRLPLKPTLPCSFDRTPLSQSWFKTQMTLLKTTTIKCPRGHGPLLTVSLPQVPSGPQQLGGERWEETALVSCCCRVSEGTLRSWACKLVFGLWRDLFLPSFPQAFPQAVSVLLKFHQRSSPKSTGPVFSLPKEFQPFYAHTRVLPVFPRRPDLWRFPWASLLKKLAGSVRHSLRFSFLSISREKLARSVVQSQKHRLRLGSESSKSSTSNFTAAGKRCRPVCQTVAKPNKNLEHRALPLPTQTMAFPFSCH